MLQKIQKLCLENGITVNRIESACNLSHGSIRKWEDHSPAVDKVKNVADYFGITVDDLLKG